MGEYRVHIDRFLDAFFGSILQGLHCLRRGFVVSGKGLWRVYRRAVGPGFEGAILGYAEGFKISCGRGGGGLSLLGSKKIKSSNLESFQLGQFWVCLNTLLGAAEFIGLRGPLCEL